MDAFANINSKTPVPGMMVHTQTMAQLHPRMDAKEVQKRLKSTGSGGVGVGVPSAIEVSPELYTTDQLKAEANFKKEAD
jgi:hypothetical protein